jgi:hypothetical protein
VQDAGAGASPARDVITQLFEAICHNTRGGNVEDGCQGSHDELDKNEGARSATRVKRLRAMPATYTRLPRQMLMIEITENKKAAMSPATNVKMA